MVLAKLRVAVLYDTWGDEPAAVEVPVGEKKQQGKRPGKKRKEKEDREEIFDALVKLGHDPFYQVVDGTSQSLTSLAKCGADLVFNLTESFAGDDTKDMNLAAYLDLLGVPYTGAGPHAFFLSQDKAVAKKMFAFHGIRTPYFAMSYRGRIDHAHDISFPLIVKPASEDGSIGIDAESVVNSIKELMERVEYIQNQFDSPALIEEYIEGREIYAAILGSYEQAQTLPLVELDLSKLPKDLPKVATWDVKFAKETIAHKVTKSAVAQDLDEATSDLLSSTALKAYQAVKLRDYGRIDMRLTQKGEVYVIEANPNPWLASKHEFAMAARASGLSYTQLVGEIVKMSMNRHEARVEALGVV
jgi:D-alanine-D-alanine ligase